MLRRMLSRGGDLSRVALRVTSARRNTTGAAPATSGEDALKGFIESLSSENEIPQGMEWGRSTFSNITTFKGLKKSVESSKEPLSPADYLSVLRTSLFLDKEKTVAPDFIRKCGKGLSETDIASMTANDELVGIMTALLELGLKEDKIFSDLEKKLLSSLNEADLSLAAIIPFVIASSRAFYTWPKELRVALKETLTSQIRDIDSASTLIAVLSHWELTDREVSQAAADKTAQLLGHDVTCCALTVGEMCSLMSKFADRGIRDKRLLPVLSARITE